MRAANCGGGPACNTHFGGLFHDASAKAPPLTWSLEIIPLHEGGLCVWRMNTLPSRPRFLCALAADHL